MKAGIEGQDSGKDVAETQKQEANGPLPKDAERQSVQKDSCEYDRRGVLLPARARVGGIITPQ